MKENKEVIPQWAVEVAGKSKQLAEEIKLDAFLSFRECGQLLIESGYLQGKWNNSIKEYFMRETGLKKPIIANMIKLGMMTEDQFNNVVRKYPSLYLWVKDQPKLVDEAVSSKKKLNKDKIEQLLKEFKVIKGDE